MAGLDEHSGPILAQREKVTVFDCQSCGFAHVQEYRPINYRTQFWQSIKAGELQHFLDQREWWDRVYDAWLTEVEGQTAGRTMLDVGCGYGFWLKRALDRGWSGIGLEPSDEASDYASELTDNRVICTTWDGWETGEFSAVTAHWLLEHLPNPQSFLDWCYAALEPGGVLMLVVPNEWTELQERANTKAAVKYWWLDPTHYSYFSWGSLERLLSSRGFTIVHRMGTFPMEKFILAGNDYTADSALGRKCHQNIERIELAMSPTDLRRCYSALGRRGEGRDVVAFCKKVG